MAAILQTASRHTSDASRQPSRQTAEPSVALRAEQWLRREISFVISRRFENWQDPLAGSAPQICWSDLQEHAWLEAEQEAAWFRRMNYLKYRATQLRGKLSVESPCRQTIEQLESLLDEATQIRNRLTTVFLKLVIGIARRFANERFAMDELVSEGNAVLLRAVEMFDADRGFRFSTYATHAVRRAITRYVGRAARRHYTAASEQLDALEDDAHWSLPHERRMWAAVETIDALLQRLQPREKDIVCARHGWGRDEPPQTLQAIANSMGVSRERVRQIEQRAMRKLQQLAEAETQELCELW